MTSTPTPKKKTPFWLIIVIIVGACFGLAIISSIVTNVGQRVGVIPTWTPVPPSSTPGPTDTPAPTNTPGPTNTPEPTATDVPTATPKPSATPVATMEPVTLNGSGDSVVDLSLSALSVLTISASGKSNFAIIANTKTGNPDLMVNVIGAYEGQRALPPGDYQLEIKATGTWSIIATQMSRDTSTDAEVAGTGDAIRGLFVPPANRQAYHFTHDGKGNFAVIVQCDTTRDLVVNKIGVYEGDNIVNYSGAQACYWDIHANGAWAITPK